MHRRAIALVLGAALLATAPAGADAGPRDAGSRLLRRMKLLRPTPGRKAKAPRGAGVTSIGWLSMAGAATVAQPGAYAIGLPRALVEHRTAPGSWGRQRKSQWCWAAASQMILNYLGLPVSQEDVIVRAYGGYIDRPASMAEIAVTLDGWLVPGALGVARRVSASPYDAITSDLVVRDLSAGRPLVVGLRNPDGQGGHGYVLSAMTYDVDHAGRVIGRTLTLRDPWPDSPSVREVSWDDFAARFIGAVRIDVN